MKTTNFKDSVKVNQSSDYARALWSKYEFGTHKTHGVAAHALCVVQTVSLHKLADAMPTAVDKDSNLRRLQRFFAKYVLDLDIIARMIFSLLPVKDRSCAEHGPDQLEVRGVQYNILMLGITYKGIAFL